MLRVAEIMSDKLITVEPSTKLGEVVHLMRTYGCRQLPVVSEGRLVGIVTDRDVRLAMNSPLTLHERREDEALLASVAVEACMTLDPVTIDSDASSALAAQLLHTHKFGGLPVLQGEKLIGSVTVSDILISYVSLTRAMEAAAD